MGKTARPQRFRKKWRIRWVDHDGKRQSRVFDKYADADLALRRVQSDADRVRVGELAPPPPRKTFNDLADYWEKYRLPLKRSQKDDRSILRRHLRPMFGTTKLADITVAQVDEFVRTRAKLSPKTIHNHLTLLIAMLNVAIDLGWLRAKPRIRKPRLTWDDYSYLRTDEEVLRFLEAAKAEGPVVFAMYCTAVYTGMRAGELCGLQWDNVDLERRLITVLRSYSRPTKTGEIRHVPILDPLLPVLQEWRLQNPLQHVFPNERGGMQGPSARILQEIFHRVLERAGMPRAITFHDLRHTFASHWMMRGGDIFRLQRILGHKSTQMTQRYSHLSPDVFKEDYGRLANLVPREPRNNVTPFHQRQVEHHSAQDRP